LRFKPAILSLFIVLMAIVIVSRMAGPYLWHYGPRKEPPVVTETLPPPDEHVSTILASHPA